MLFHQFRDHLFSRFLAGRVASALPAITINMADGKQDEATETGHSRHHFHSFAAELRPWRKKVVERFTNA
jgi:hypothetical protein